MRKFVTLGALAIAAAATPALADDSDASWTGAYVGVNAGYTDAKSDQTVVLGGNWSTESAALQTRVATDYPTASHVKDFNYGGQIGFNVQVGSSLVVGIEADVSGLSGKDSQIRTSAGAPTYTIANTFDPKVTYGVKGKLGFAAGNTLFYATGGYGWTQADLATDITSSGGYHKAALSAIPSTAMKWAAASNIASAESSGCGWNMSIPIRVMSPTPPAMWPAAHS